MLNTIRQRIPSWETLWSEVWNVFKFGVVGVTSLGINEGVYALFSRVLFPWLHLTVSYVLSVAVSGIFNFTMHRLWTFKARAFNNQMLFRYIVVVLIGMALSGGLFYIGTDLLHIHDLVVPIGAAFIVAGATYFLHRWYTFHPKHNQQASVETA